MSGEQTPPPDMRGQGSPAGQHFEGHRANSKRFGKDIYENFYHWIRKQQPSPGAMAFAFETMSLPELSPIDHAVCVRKGFSAFAGSAQVYVPVVAVPTAGLGGLVQGQFISQPLYDPYSNTYGGSPSS